MIKTSAATGQKTGNVISAVWQVPGPMVEARGQVMGGAREDTDTGQLSGMQVSSKMIQSHPYSLRVMKENLILLLFCFDCN